MTNKGILFINEGLSLGGIETYLVRISKKLHEQGYTLKFLFFSDVYDLALFTELKRYGSIYFIDDYLLGTGILKNTSPLLKLLLPKRAKMILADLLENLSYLIATDYNSVLFAGKITTGNMRIKTLIGIYHINEFDFSSHKGWYFHRLTTRLMNDLPAQNLLMYNEAIRSNYSDAYSQKFINNTIITLGVDVEKVEDLWVGQQNNRIVSIGRLTEWKRYNYAMIDVIHDYKNKGIIYSYDSYGDGVSRDQLVATVEKLGLSDQIKFHLPVPYEEFTSVIKNSLLFIGAGTALIEASACGLPSLIGIENESKPISYGFLHDTTGSSYQEKQLELPFKKISQFITELSTSNNTDYMIECKKAKERAQYFGMKKAYTGFVGYLENSGYFSFKLNYLQIVCVISSMLFNKILRPKTNYSNRL